MRKTLALVLIRELLFSLIITSCIQSSVGYPYPDLKGTTIPAVFPDTTAISSKPQKEILATPVPTKTVETISPDSDPYQFTPTDPNNLFDEVVTIADDVFCPNWKEVRKGTSPEFANALRKASSKRRDLIIESPFEAIEAIRICLIHILRQGRPFFHLLFTPKHIQDMDLMQSVMSGGSPEPHDVKGDRMTESEPHKETSLSPIEPEPTPPPNQDITAKSLQLENNPKKNEEKLFITGEII